MIASIYRLRRRVSSPCAVLSRLPALGRQARFELLRGMPTRASARVGMTPLRHGAVKAFFSVARDQSGYLIVAYLKVTVATTARWSEG